MPGSRASVPPVVLSNLGCFDEAGRTGGQAASGTRFVIVRIASCRLRRPRLTSNRGYPLMAARLGGRASRPLLVVITPGLTPGARQVSRGTMAACSPWRASMPPVVVRWCSGLGWQVGPHWRASRQWHPGGPQLISRRRRHRSRRRRAGSRRSCRTGRLRRHRLRGSCRNLPTRPRGACRRDSRRH